MLQGTTASLSLSLFYSRFRHEFPLRLLPLLHTHDPDNQRDPTILSFRLFVPGMLEEATYLLKPRIFSQIIPFPFSLFFLFSFSLFWKGKTFPNPEGINTDTDSPVRNNTPSRWTRVDHRSIFFHSRGCETMAFVDEEEEEEGRVEAE